MWLVAYGSTDFGPTALGVPLPEGAVTIGRHQDCDLVLNERDVSRKHVLIRRIGSAVTFEDLDSLSGTFLNGVVTTKGELRPGDVLRLGHTELRLQDVCPFADPPAAAEAAAVARSRTVVDWRPFRSFFRQLREPGEPRQILERLLLGLVELFGARRGFVLLRPGGGAELTTVASYQLEDATSFVAVSSTVYRRVLETEAVVFVPDTSDDPVTASAPSLDYEFGARSILCGPLAGDGQVFGVIYVDCPAGAGGFDEATLPLFEMLVEMASELLRASDMRRQLLADRGRIVAFQSLSADGSFFVGQSEAGRVLERLVEAAAPKDVTVLLTGETGTGKEMVARAIHDLSGRRSQPFVPVNCAALPAEIIEAELFGAERGAYTGATERRIGRFELASEGTLFLDEVGELPLEFQVKLLRVLQERTITRLGGNETIPVSFRLICATNADLEAAIRAGTFRQDFFFRINVFRIPLPPLRERMEDTLPLARRFLDEYAMQFGKHLKGFSEEAERALLSYAWPGNVRELRNAVERAVVLETGDVVRVDNLPLSTGGDVETAEAVFLEHLPKNYDDARDMFEKAFIRRSYILNEGNVSAVARDTGIPRNTLYRRLDKYGFLDKKNGS